MNTNDSALHIRLDRRTLLRSLLLATGGIITNSLSAEALALTPRQKNNQFPTDATPNEETNARALACLRSRFSDVEEEMEKSLYRLKAIKRFQFAKIEEEMENKVRGEKMLCIDDSFTDERAALCNALPVRGQIYILRAIRVAVIEDNKPQVAILFDEIVNTRLIFGKELGFLHARFEFCDSDDVTDAGEQEEQGTEDSKLI